MDVEVAGDGATLNRPAILGSNTNLERLVESDLSARWRPWILLAGVACFCIQTGLVYHDFRQTERSQEFSRPAQEGLRLWRSNNCHTCHQIHGYGGFLGPDLTNLMSRRPDEDLSAILTTGRKQMPAFHFDEEEQAAIRIFLEEVDLTGTSIPSFCSVEESVDAGTIVTEFASSTNTSVPQEVLQGEIIANLYGCYKCHAPFSEGRLGAPDLTSILRRRGREKAVRALREGKGTMPQYELADVELEQLLAYLGWLGDNRAQVGSHYATDENGTSFRWTAVPWFEY